jgi:photosystem II stability/assembly factor-like uncharacterized protein
MRFLESPNIFHWVIATLAWLAACTSNAQDVAWTKRGPSDVPNVTGVALDPNNPQILYSVSDANGSGKTGIRKSVDGGDTWSDIGAGDQSLSSLTCVMVDDSSGIYVGGSGGLVASTHNGGATWSKNYLGDTPVTSIVFDGVNAFAATRSKGYYETNSFSTAVSSSGDGGKTWAKTGFQTPGSVYALLANAVGKHLLAGTDYSYFSGYYGFLGPITPQGGEVATSANGSKWDRPTPDLGFAVTALVQSPHGARALGGTASGQILQSTDGTSWQRLGAVPGTVSALVVDPTSDTTVYASLTNGGIFRSFDGGVTWRPFDFGLTDDSVRSLAIDPTGQSLYAGTASGVFHRDLPPASTSPCQAGDDHLCLLGARFRVDLYAIDPNTQARAAVKAFSGGDRYGYFSVPELTGDAELPEVMVKMLDATALPGQGYWAFSAALTNIRYSVVVADTVTGRLQIYDGQSFCGVTDAPAFSAQAYVTTLRGAQLPEVLSTELRLLSNRFHLTLTAADPRTGHPVTGAANALGDRFGYFSLPALTADPTFPEVLVKMIDATGTADHDFWLFQGGLTSLFYALTVLDTVTGVSKTYYNDPVDLTHVCGSVDSRVTTGPTPNGLSVEWNGQVMDWSSTGTSATVHQDGDRLRISWIDLPNTASLFIDGTLSTGHVAGTLRLQSGGCQFEDAASGVAITTHIQMTSENQLTGPCGVWGPLTVDFTPFIPPSTGLSHR